MAIIESLRKVQTCIGIVISWLSLLMVMTMFAVVILRYAFNLGWIALQESVVYMHAFLFMLGSAYTLQMNGHVRVDIFYQNFQPKTQAIINILGSLLFLVPVSLCIFWMSWEYVLSSWAIHEASREAGGLPLVYVLKSLLFAMPILLLLQAIIEVAHNFQILLREDA